MAPACTIFPCTIEFDYNQNLLIWNLLQMFGSFFVVRFMFFYSGLFMFWVLFDTLKKKKKKRLFYGIVATIHTSTESQYLQYEQFSLEKIDLTTQRFVNFEPSTTFWKVLLQDIYSFSQRYLNLQ